MSKFVLWNFHFFQCVKVTILSIAYLLAKFWTFSSFRDLAIMITIFYIFEFMLYNFDRSYVSIEVMRNS